VFANVNDLKNDLKRRMDAAVEVLKKEFAGLRTGRASTNLLEPITVEAYGSTMHLNQVAAVSVPEPRLITVQVWDKGMIKAVEKAIRESNLGLNPQTDGQLIRVPIPPLSEERRTEMTKVAGKYAEQTRVAIRNVRREGMETLKKMEKDSKISQDDHRHLDKDIQQITDDAIKHVDETVAHKTKEIMQV
jgi:ribosome recycling factor